MRSTIMTMDSTSIPFIFRLPKAWLTAFISDWLSIKEKVHFDSAVTNHEHRDHFLACLRHSHPEKHWIVDNVSLQWLSLRRISIHSIDFTCDISKIQTLSNLRLPLLVSLEVYFLEGEETIDQAIYYLIRNSPEIQSIKLQTNAEITDAGVLHIANCCPLLKDLFLCPWGNDGITITALMHLFDHCTLLDTVGLTQSVLSNYSGADLQQLKDYGHLFDALTVFNEPFHDESIEAKDIVDLLACCPHVRELDYTSAHADDDAIVLQRLGDVCPIIEMFSFNKVGGGEDEEETGQGIIPVSTYVNAFRRCVHLKDISLYGDVMQHFTDLDFKCLEEFGPLINTLILETQREDEQLTSQGFASLLGHCSQLHSLVCHGMDEGDAILLQCLGEKCPKLHDISLTDVTNVTNESLLALLQGCPKLVDLTLSCKSTMNTPTDAIFTPHPFNTSLTKIDLRVSGVIWNEMTVATCFSQCHQLEVFKVVWGLAELDGVSESLVDTGLAILTTGCPKLREIKLYSSPLLTINGVIQLCETCPGLTECPIYELLIGDAESNNLYPMEQMNILRGRFPAIKFTLYTFGIGGGQVQPWGDWEVVDDIVE